MQMVVVSIRDRATDLFARPLFVAAKGQAIRMFQDEINRNAADNPLYSHPDDYDLYVLGVFDDATGLFESHVPRQIAVGKEMVVPTK